MLILVGAGGEAFSAGADLKALDTLTGRIHDPGGPEGFTRLKASKPTIAAIDGWTTAGGLELALWCDLRFATSHSRFAFLERRWGVPLLDGGTQRLPRLIGQGRALDLIPSGRVIDAQEAKAIGLITDVVAPGEHLSRALEVAERLASYPQDTMLADRAALLRAFDQLLEHGLALEERLGSQTLATALTGAERFARGAGRHGADTSGADT